MQERTIKEVMNLDTRELIYADDFFLQDENIIWKYRELCQEAIKKRRDPFLVCFTCGQLVQISGGRGERKKVTYFKHLKDSKDCPIKTDSNSSKEDILRGKYNGQKEGKEHIETKRLIASFLELNKSTKGEISRCDLEKVIKGNRDFLKWRKPDITSLFKDKTLVFEIQLSTTFLDVICERQYFYKEKQMFILWVFRKFEIEEDKQRFTQKDVFYSNNRNAFILNDEAIRLSEENKDLYLLCQYQEPIARGERLIYEWREKYVCLSELIFDETTYKVYYYDVDKAEQKICLEIEQNILERKKREEERLLRYREEEEKRIEEEESRNNLRLLEIEREKEIQKERGKKIQKELSEYREKYSSFFDRLKKYPNHSPLQKVFYEVNISSKIEELFLIEKYIPSKEDKFFLKEEYNREFSTGKSGCNSILEYLSYITFYIKALESSLDLSLISKKGSLLLAILSIKQKKVIGYNFRGVIQIAHLFFQERDRYYPYSGIILEAIEVYYKGVNNFIEQEDKKNTFLNKLEKMKKDNPPQDNTYNEIINAIFPDLDL
ncbi:DUF6035 family protein [Capnocytophaga granulosa]|uniref:DUF6035 family protein n=1 Tax=Capnocytophaga granulosa TaxID=45242 RepID=UPI0028EA6854|nr:DUF6035 family protein [Capnocytophaga granulosa]